LDKHKVGLQYTAIQRTNLQQHCGWFSHRIWWCDNHSQSIFLHLPAASASGWQGTPSPFIHSIYALGAV